MKAEHSSIKNVDVSLFLSLKGVGVENMIKYEIYFDVLNKQIYLTGIPLSMGIITGTDSKIEMISEPNYKGNCILCSDLPIETMNNFINDAKILMEQVFTSQKFEELVEKYLPIKKADIYNMVSENALDIMRDFNLNKLGYLSIYSTGDAANRTSSFRKDKL